MKRRMPGGRAGHGGPVSGPLMTDHLRDLDLELELLKRKRTMIEQQQRMLSGNQHDFQQNQHSYEPSYDRVRNYSHLYEDDHRGQAPQSQFNQNYHSDAVWDSAPQANFPAPQSGNYEFSGYRNNDRFANKKKPRRPNPWADKTPLLGNPVSAPPFKHGPRPSAKMTRGPPPPKYNNSRVSKPNHKPYVPPNNLNKQSTEARKSLVAKASDLVHKISNSHRSVSETFNPDVEPSKQVAGRMEWGLGMVLKNLRTLYSKSHPRILNNPESLRTLKQTIRERIKNVMIGKKVDGNLVVLETYRRDYPESTDKELLELCIAEETARKHKNVVMPFLPEDDPEKFFKINFHKLFVNRLDDMFKKIAALSKEKSKKSYEEIIKDLPDVNAKVEAEKTNGSVEEAVDKDDKDAMTSKEQTDAALEKTETDIAAEDKDTNAGENETDDLKDAAAVEIDTAGNDKAATEKENPEPAKPTETADDSKKMDADTVVKDVNNSMQETTTEETEPKENKKAGEEGPTMLSDVQKTKFYINLLDQLIEQRLPHYLMQKTEQIYRIMSIDLQFKATRAAVILETNRKAEKLAKYPVEKEKRPYKPSNREDKTPSETPEKSADEKKRNAPLIHVKIVAKPNLPETSIMKAFLDKFNPKMIKKPKSIQNMLIVGLGSEEDAEMIIAASGATVGTKKLQITRSGKNTKASPANPDIKSDTTETNSKPDGVDTDTKPVEVKTENVLITDELDTQITELLTSIRNSEDVNKNQAAIVEKKEDNVPVKEEITLATSNKSEEKTDSTTATGDDAGLEVDTPVESPATESLETISEVDDASEVKNDQVESVKAQNAPTTPKRASARLANTTPCTIKTRRTSKLAQNQ